MTDTTPTTLDESEEIPNPDALGLVPRFDPPPGEEHPDHREGQS